MRGLLRCSREENVSNNANPTLPPTQTLHPPHQTQLQNLEIARKTPETRNKIRRQSRSRCRPSCITGVHDGEMERCVYPLERGVGFVELFCGYC